MATSVMAENSNPGPTHAVLTASVFAGAAGATAALAVWAAAAGGLMKTGPVQEIVSQENNRAATTARLETLDIMASLKRRGW
jgi:hypothetical protein